MNVTSNNTTKVVAANYEFSFTDDDVCNPEEAVWAGDYNPHNNRLWLLHDHGFTVAVVWADCLQNALDEAVDAGKMDRYLVTADEADYYGCTDIYECEGLSYLGNASEPFDIESLGYVEFAPPKLSLTALCGETISSISHHFGC